MDSAWVGSEMSGAVLGDPRQALSVVRITAALCENRHLSLTAACGPGLRQAAHRVFEHPETTVDGLLAGHYQSTAKRCAELSLVLVAQDTTTFSYAQEQLEGLGRVNRAGKTGGLLAHSALAMTEDGTPLGLLGLELWGCTDGSLPCLWEKESGKWRAGLEAVAKRLPPDVRAVLIQDREGDFYEFLSAPRPERIDLLVRASQDRKVRDGEGGEGAEAGRLFRAASGGRLLGELRVRVPNSGPNPHQILPRHRDAVLEVRVAEVRLQRPDGSGATAEEIAVRVVQAREASPPPGEKRVSWTLLTTLPAATLEEACRIVGYYARRWIIERLHFTLKSGLRAERLQIDDALSLSRCLALYYVVAWRLLQLTYLAREDPDRPAADILSRNEIAVLEALCRNTVRTLSEAVREIAKLGGYEYYRNAPPPGVKRIWLGWQRLTPMVEGWELRDQQLRESMTLD